MRFLLTILVAMALGVFVLVSGCGLISGMGDDSGSDSADTTADISTSDASFRSEEHTSELQSPA